MKKILLILGIIALLIFSFGCKEEPQKQVPPSQECFTTLSTSTIGSDHAHEWCLGDEYTKEFCTESVMCTDEYPEGECIEETICHKHKIDLDKNLAEPAGLADHTHELRKLVEVQNDVPPSPPEDTVCGDAICIYSQESCETCPEDCGECDEEPETLPIPPTPPIINKATNKSLEVTDIEWSPRMARGYITFRAILSDPGDQVTEVKYELLYGDAKAGGQAYSDPWDWSYNSLMPAPYTGTAKIRASAYDGTDWSEWFETELEIDNE